ncbi:putative signal peptide protein [Puccinia sorghi]|uniref:Putative signal peptide protein n=1 Tax=Puccinia sorghi TaxID=27349 RepID=A0A0L6VW32_9BASI|nr:putative signal peptide protein [Puccinia sorghi]
MKVDLTILLMSLVVAGGANARPIYPPHYPHYPVELATSIQPLHQQLAPNLWHGWPTQYHQPLHPLPPGGQIPATGYPILGHHASWHPQQVNHDLVYPLRRPPVASDTVRQMRQSDPTGRLEIRFASNPDEAPEKSLFRKYTYMENGVETPLFSAVVLQNDDKAMLYIKGLSPRTAQYKIWLPSHLTFWRNAEHEIPYGITSVYEFPKRNLANLRPGGPPMIHFSGFKSPEVHPAQPDPANGPPVTQVSGFEAPEVHHAQADPARSPPVTQVSGFEAPEVHHVQPDPTRSPPAIEFSGFKAPEVHHVQPDPTSRPPVTKLSGFEAPEVHVQPDPTRSPPVTHSSGFEAWDFDHIQPDPASVYPQVFFPELPSHYKALLPIYLEEDVM